MSQARRMFRFNSGGTRSFRARMTPFCQTKAVFPPGSHWPTTTFESFMACADVFVLPGSTPKSCTTPLVQMKLLRTLHRSPHGRMLDPQIVVELFTPVASDPIAPESRMPASKEAVSCQRSAVRSQKAGVRNRRSASEACMDEADLIDLGAAGDLVLSAVRCRLERVVGMLGRVMQ